VPGHDDHFSVLLSGVLGDAGSKALLVHDCKRGRYGDAVDMTKGTEDREDRVLMDELVCLSRLHDGGGTICELDETKSIHNQCTRLHIRSLWELLHERPSVVGNITLSSLLVVEATADREGSPGWRSWVRVITAGKFSILLRTTEKRVLKSCSAVGAGFRLRLFGLHIFATNMYRPVMNLVLLWVDSKAQRRLR
jgi:hypothetical protein